MSDLTGYSVEQLCIELRTRGVIGIISVKDKETGRLDMWWGDLVKCLGYTYRLAHEINTQMDEYEETDDPDDDEAEEGLDELAKEFPQIGQYL